MYKYRTPFLGIPVVGRGEILDAAEERKKFIILENALRGASGSLKDCVFADGEYSVSGNDDGTWNVSLIPSATSMVAAQGVVGQAFFNLKQGFSWKNIPAGSLSYLYIKGDKAVFEFPEKAMPVFYPIKMPGLHAHVIMASLDCSGESPVLDTEPDGKLRIQDFGLHYASSDCPHGKSLTQDVLVVRERIVLGKDAVVERDGSAAATISAEPPQMFFMTISSPGNAGVSVEVPGASHVEFATGSVMVSDSEESVGEISFGYFGQDTSVFSRSSMSVYNSGAIGRPIRLCVYYRRDETS